MRRVSNIGGSPATAPSPLSDPIAPAKGIASSSLPTATTPGSGIAPAKPQTDAPFYWKPRAPGQYEAIHNDYVFSDLDHAGRVESGVTNVLNALQLLPARDPVNQRLFEALTKYQAAVAQSPGAAETDLDLMAGLDGFFEARAGVDCERLAVRRGLAAAAAMIESSAQLLRVSPSGRAAVGSTQSYSATATTSSSSGSISGSTSDSSSSDTVRRSSPTETRVAALNRVARAVLPYSTVSLYDALRRKS
jgi:hypothetical protein